MSDGSFEGNFDDDCCAVEPDASAYDADVQSVLADVDPTIDAVPVEVAGPFEGPDDVSYETEPAFDAEPAYDGVPTAAETSYSVDAAQWEAPMDGPDVAAAVELAATGDWLERMDGSVAPAGEAFPGTDGWAPAPDQPALPIEGFGGTEVWGAAMDHPAPATAMPGVEGAAPADGAGAAEGVDTGIWLGPLGHPPVGPGPDGVVGDVTAGKALKAAHALAPDVVPLTIPDSALDF